MLKTISSSPTKQYPPSKISYDQFLQDYIGQHAEWLDGEVIVYMSASHRHQDIVLWLGAILRLFVEVFGLGAIYIAPFNMKTPTIKRGREPDILFVVKERLHLVKEAHLDGPADLAIEIVSPESSERDRETKFKEYQTAEVREYWIIDPLMEEALFYQLNSAGIYQAIPLSAQGHYHSAILSGFWLDVAWFWQKPLPTLITIYRALGLFP